MTLSVLTTLFILQLCENVLVLQVFFHIYCRYLRQFFSKEF